MLDLEVIPERSLGCPEKAWEFILGKFIFPLFFLFFVLMRIFFLCIFSINRNAFFSGSCNYSNTSWDDQERSDFVQWTGARLQNFICYCLRLFTFVSLSKSGASGLWHRYQLAIEWTPVDFRPDITTVEGNRNLQHETCSSSILRTLFQLPRNSTVDRADWELVWINSSCHLWRCQELFCFELSWIDVLFPCRQQNASKFR